MDSNSRNAMVGLVQSRDRLENGRGKDNKMSRGVWKAVETSAEKIGMGKAERRGSKGRSQEEERRKGQEEETEKGEDDGSKESGRRMGDIG